MTRSQSFLLLGALILLLGIGALLWARYGEQIAIGQAGMLC